MPSEIKLYKSLKLENVTIKLNLHPENFMIFNKYIYRTRTNKGRSLIEAAFQKLAKIGAFH